MGFGVSKVSIAIFFAAFLVFTPAFAVDTNDSAPIGTKTYAATSVRVSNCAPYGGDPSHDGICAHWKDGTNGPGLHIDFNDNSIGGTMVHYKYDLGCNTSATLQSDPSGYTVCPSTNQQDIYVELDCMTGQCPQPQAIYNVVSAFAQHGIVLHVQMGESPSTGSGDIGVHFCDVKRVTTNYDQLGATCSPTTTNYQSYPSLKQNFFGTPDERSGNTAYCPLNGVPPGFSPSNANSFNCLTAKRQVFHYGMFVDYQISGTDTSGWAEIPGNDFIISLGGFTSGVGSPDEQQGALMHELGHNLGLNHGGANDLNNCKPNYLSVMNYVYMFGETADSCRPLDYSNAALGSLNEGSLSDSNIGSYQYPSGSACQGERKIFWSTPNGVVNGTTGVTNDWNQNGPDNGPYTQIMNNVMQSCSASTSPVTLNGFNDWAFLANGNPSIGFPVPLNFRNSTNFFQTVLPESGLDSDVYTQGDNHQDYPLSTTIQSTSAKQIVPVVPGGPDPTPAYAAGIAIIAVMIGIGVWTAVRRR